MSEPVSFVVTRWRCPHCTVTRSSRAGAVRHIGRCWYNPGARGCKTCVHFEPDDSDWEVGYVSAEGCRAGVALPGGTALMIHCAAWGRAE